MQVPWNQSSNIFLYIKIIFSIGRECTIHIRSNEMWVVFRWTERFYDPSHVPASSIGLKSVGTNCRTICICQDRWRGGSLHLNHNRMVSSPFVLTMAQSSPVRGTGRALTPIGVYTPDTHPRVVNRVASETIIRGGRRPSFCKGIFTTHNTSTQPNFPSAWMQSFQRLLL